MSHDTETNGQTNETNETSETTVTPVTTESTAATAPTVQKQNHNHKPAKKHVRAPILVESGQVLLGKVSGFALSDDKSTRTGVVLRFKGGDSAFMHSSEIGGHFPESRLNMLQLGDMTKVLVTVKAGPGKRKVKASEKLLFLDDVAAQLEAGLQNVSGDIVNKSNIGAFVKVTSPGAAFGFVGLLHFNSIPGGQRALTSLEVGKSIVVDITKARVDRERNVLKLTLDAFGVQRRELEDRFPAGISVSANVFKDGGDSILLTLKSGERCVLPKSSLNGVDPSSLKQGKSTNAFVTGVDARGVILLSKVMPE